MTTLLQSCVLVFLYVAGARSQGLTPGGTNVIVTGYVTYYVTVPTTTRQVNYIKTCTQTCALWIFGCRTTCSRRSIYRWVTKNKRVARSRPRYGCKTGWKQNGKSCTTPICTGGCSNGGVCIAPNNCRCITSWAGPGCTKDVNECQSSSGFQHGCQGTCVNTRGSYKCSCPKGHFLASNGKNCTDHDECAGNIHQCEQECVNFPGGYNCTCRSGYRLNISDSKTCDDVNECKENMSGCAQDCSNAVGNYSCSCHLGYHLGMDGKSCNDTDECKSGVDNCEHNCHNTEGSYNCSCRPGFDLARDQRHCIGRPCEEIKAPANGKMSCSGNTTEHDCNFECAPGYELIGSSNRTCNATNVWTGIQPICNIIHCPTPAAPQEGFVYTPCNTEYTSECIVGCARGYFVEGPSMIRCNARGFWQPSNLTCSRIEACEPSLCLNGGKCISVSLSRYMCDCSNTGYKGSRCEVATISTPVYPTLTRGVPSVPLKFQSSPAINGYVIVTPSSLEVDFNPPSLIFNTTTSQQSMTVTPHQPGLYFIQYSLSGPNAAEFQVPQRDVILVEQILSQNSTTQTNQTLSQNSSNQTAGFLSKNSTSQTGRFISDNSTSDLTRDQTQNITLPIGCHEIALGKCPGKGNAIFSLSTSPWNVAGPMMSTSGIVVVKVGRTILPLSLLGTNVNTKSLPSTEKSCKTRYRYSVEELLKSRVITKSFLKSVNESFPSWLSIRSPSGVKSNNFLLSDLRTYFLSSEKLRQTDVGKGQPFPGKTSFSLFQTRHVNLTIERDVDVLKPRDNGELFSLAVDLCSSSPRNVVIRPLLENVNLVKNVSVLKRLKESGWDLTVYSLQISKTKSIEKLEKGLFWNGNGYVRVNETTVGNLALVSSLRKSFAVQDIAGCDLEFDGTMVIRVENIDNISQSPLDQNWSVDLYGNMKLTLRLKVEGTKTNVTLNAAKSISYATFGGRPQEIKLSGETSSEGLYISHTVENSPFLFSALSKFVEIGSNTTVSAFVDIKLQSNKTGNGSENGDILNAVKMVFQGHLKFGPLRFDNVDIKLRTENERKSDTSIELEGKQRDLASRQVGIFYSNHSNPRIYISSKESVSSRGSFKSVVKILGFESMVNVSFFQDGLVINTTGKVHGLFDAYVICKSPLASWEEQTFVAKGEFVTTQTSALVKALDKALYDYGTGVYNRAKKRVDSFKQREERANARVKNIQAFLETKRQEVNKSREEYKIAGRNLQDAQNILRYIEGNVSGRLDGLRLRLDQLCPRAKHCPDICREGVVCRNCNYELVGKTKKTCLSSCVKTEQKLIKTNSGSVTCKTQSCERVYLKSALTKEDLRNTLTVIRKDTFSYGKIPSGLSRSTRSTDEMDAQSTFFPGNTKEGVCASSNKNILGNTDSNSEKLCGKDKRDGHWECHIRPLTCSRAEYEYENYRQQYTCEKPCEQNVTEETITRSCCSSVQCAFKMVNVSCVAENVLCSKIRNDALDKNLHQNSSPEILITLDSARKNVSHWQIMKRKATIRLASALNLLNITAKAVENLRNAHNITLNSERNISKILKNQLKLKELFKDHSETVVSLKFKRIKFNVKIGKENENSLLPVTIMLKLNGSDEELSAVLDFKRLNTSLRSIAKSILGMHMRETSGQEVTNPRKKRSVNTSNSTPTNTSMNETTHHTISSLQKYHQICSEFTNFERALYDMSMSLYNLTSDTKQFVHQAGASNASKSLNTTRILENLNLNDTIMMEFKLNTSKTVYISDLEKDIVVQGALELENEAIRDGYKPLYLTSQLLFRNWYSAIESIFNVVLEDCSGFEDCFIFITDGLSEMNEATNLPGADKMRVQIAELKAKLGSLIQNVDMSIENAAEVSSSILKILESMTNVKLFCALAPNITKQPEPLTELGVGQTLVLKCNASGDALVYNWLLNGNILNDQTSNVLLISNTTLSNAGNYTCVVSNHISKEISASALVVIHSPPSITVQPTERLNVVLSANDSLRCMATSSENDLSYQWWFKYINASSFVALAGEVFSYLNFAPMTAAQEGLYLCNVSNSYGFTISRKSYVKALSFSLPVPVATLSISVSRKSRENITRFTRAVPAYEQIQRNILGLLLSARGNVSNTSTFQIKNLRPTECKPIISPDVNGITEDCQWTFVYVGENVTTHSTLDFEVNAQKVINISRKLNSAINDLVKKINQDGLSFVVGNQKFTVEKNSLSVGDVYMACSEGQKLVKEDFRCVDCPPGSYGKKNGNMVASCLRCPVDSYQPSSGQTSCIQCPEGFTTVNEGSIDSEDCKVICPSGKYGKITRGIGQCLECEVNTYQPKKGQFECLSCPNGQITTAKGSDDISKCTPEPTERHTTKVIPGITTTKEVLSTTATKEVPSTTTTEEPTDHEKPGVGESSGSQNGTNYRPIVGGVVGGIILLCIFSLLILFIARKRRNLNESSPTDQKNIVVSKSSFDWHSNPAFIDENDFSHQGRSTENPTYEPSDVWVSSPSDGKGKENPTYEKNPDRDPPEEEIPTEKSAWDKSFDTNLKVYKSYENERVSNFDNPLYEVLAMETKRKETKLSFSDNPPDDSQA